MKPTRRPPPRPQPLRNRLALSYAVVVLIGMGLVTPIAWFSVEWLYLRSQTSSLLAQAQLVASALGNSPVQPANTSSATPVPYSQVSNAMPGIHTRLIDPQGGVVIELAAPGLVSSGSELQLPRLAQNGTNGAVSQAELLGRSEIVMALQGQASTTVRRVEAAGGQRVLYAAAPVLDSSGAVTQIVYLATPLPETQWSALPGLTRLMFIGAVLAALMLSGWAAFLLGRRISHPLEALVEAVQAVGEGDLCRQVPEDRSIAELASLGKAFNSMTTSLNQSDQAKTAFISDVTHELRTPLTVIKGTIETLQDGALDDLKARGPFLESMGKETDRLIRMVNDLLLLTRADAGALNLRLQKFDLGELASRRAVHFERLAGIRKVRIATIVETPKEWDGYGKIAYTVKGDPDRLAQVLDNLLDNAIRYARVDSVVTVRLRRNAERVVCAVEDSGMCIPQDHLPFIFERFYRVDKSRQREQGGSGLGLAIVRSLAQAHGGGVSVESDEQRTVVSFWVPAG